MNYPIKHSNEVAPKRCNFLYNAMETTGFRQGMGVMFSDVIEAVFHSDSTWDSMP